MAKKPEMKEQVGGVRLSAISAVMVILIALLSAGLLYSSLRVYQASEIVSQSVDHYIESRESAVDMISGSTVLTDSVRRFAITFDTKFIFDYFEEATVTRQRSDAVKKLQAQNPDDETQAELQRALNESNALMIREIYSMRLVLDAKEIPTDDLPEQVQRTKLSFADTLLTAEEKITKAQQMLFDDEYEASKRIITENASAVAENLQRRSYEQSDAVANELNYWIMVQRVLIVIMIAAMAFIVFASERSAFRPLRRAVTFIRSKQPLRHEGAHEFRILVDAYNAMLEETVRREEELTFTSMHDALTGLYNRRAYDYFSERVDFATSTVLELDIDHFKTYNDTYGHAVGDKVICRVADLLRANFRHYDLAFRMGGDEFVLVMRKTGPFCRELIREKIHKINSDLQHPEDDVPACSLSVGIAFGNEGLSHEEIVQMADDAMYEVKESGKCGCKFAN